MRRTIRIGVAAQGNRRTGVCYRRLYLPAVANNSRLSEDALDVCAVERCDMIGDETSKSSAKCVAFGQYRAPGEPSLEAFQDETLKHADLVVNGESPFTIVIVTDKFVVGGPGRADEAIVAPYEPIGNGKGKRGVV
jgi:hypothetical protein